MNQTNSRASLDIVHMFMDVIIIIASFVISYYTFGQDMITPDKLKVGISVFAVCAIVFVLANRSLQIYDNTVFFYTDRIIRRESVSFAIAFFCGCLICGNITGFNAGFIILLSLVSYIMILLEILLFRRLIDHIVSRKHISRVIYVGSKDSYNKFRYFQKKTSVLVNEIGYVSFDDEDDGIEYIGALSDLENVIKKYNIDEVYFLQKREMDTVKLQQYIDLCIIMGVSCRVIVDTFRRRRANSYVSCIGTYPLITFHTISLNNGAKTFKRIFDIFFALFAIIVTSPIMLITAIAIRIDSPGPAIFKQVRVGKNGRHFRIWKFRSMYTNAEEMKEKLKELNQVSDGMMFKIKDDPRITRVGKFIRKTSIDELPQFFNVLFGSMSVVGTRPPTLDEVAKYSAKQWRRLSIKPGITGMWQANGRSDIKDFDKVVELDTQYIDEWTPLLDIKIIFKTVLEVVAHKNAF